jgi:hypothetical protein
MKWMQKENILLSSSENSLELIEKVTQLLKNNFNVIHTAKDVYVPAIPEYGFVRKLTVEGKSLFLSQESIPEDPVCLVFEKNEDRRFIASVKELLEKHLAN